METTLRSSTTSSNSDGRILKWRTAHILGHLIRLKVFCIHQGFVHGLDACS